MPGSASSMRRIRSPASGVPSATITWPACSDLPMPTPPPWWNETQLAPVAVLTSALRIGQAATASVPSGIARVGPVAHPLGLALRRGAAAGVEMVAPDHDRALHGARRHQVVEAQPGDV